MAEYEPWSFIKQFSIKLRTYQKLFGFLWHIAIPAVLIVLIWSAVSFISSLFHKPNIKSDNRQTIEAKDNSRITNNYITNKDASWEAGLQGGVIRLDNKNGIYGGGDIRKKF